MPEADLRDADPGRLPVHPARAGERLGWGRVGEDPPGVGVLTPGAPDVSTPSSADVHFGTGKVWEVLL